MDDNKLKTLVDIGYAIKPCCDICQFSVIQRRSGWGVCSEHEYEVTKPISIHRSGVCSRFLFSHLKASALKEFGVFYRGNDGGN